MAERDVDRTPSKARAANASAGETEAETAPSGPGGLTEANVDAHGQEVAFHSAYTAPLYPRPQAERDDMAGLGQLGTSHDNRKRGDLTAHNLELIPDADQVAPGIRLGREGNEGYGREGQRSSQNHEAFNDIDGHGAASLAHDHLHHMHDHEDEDDEHGDAMGSDDVNDDDDDDDDDDEEERGNQGHPSRRGMARGGVGSTKTPSSVGAQGSSSAGHGAGLDVDDDDDDDVDHVVSVVHERVGGSGATSENASKGASVGHFGPRGEAIPGVPPHLDPRQPNFRPPSPGAASVLSVAVHPPASPKALGPSGLGASASAVPPGGDTIVDSGEETESLGNGALTPTLSDDGADMGSDNFHDADDADPRDRRGSPTPGPELQSSPSAQALGPFTSLHLESPRDGGRINNVASSIRGRDRDLFGPGGSSSSLSYPSSSSFLHRTSISGSIGDTPSVAATAGSSRAPSTRGLSPSAPMSRGLNGDAEFNENDGSSLSQDDLDRSNSMGAETPSLSRKSSFGSAPSSSSAIANRDDGLLPLAADANSSAVDAALVRTRGGTLTAGPGSGLGLAGVGSGGGGGGTGLHPSGEEDSPQDGEGGAPSLAPSEAGSDSTRSMTVDSSVGHGQPHGYIDRVGGGGPHPSSLAQQRLASSSYSLLSPSMPPPSSSTATLPSLLALKEAARKQQGSSRAASTAATNGTTSPASSLSIDGSLAGDEEYFDSSARDEVSTEA